MSSSKSKAYLKKLVGISIASILSIWAVMSATKENANFFKLVPPIVVIMLAFSLEEALFSITLGSILGLVLINLKSGASFWTSLSNSLMDFPAKVIIKVLSDADHVKIVVFSLMLGGVVGIISKSGSVMNLVNKLATRIKSPRAVQLFSFLLGVGIFFDDYANTLIVGNTSRPLTDKFKISREKLAYIVDSTSAPVVGMAIISTWIGYELSVVGTSFQVAGWGENPYIAFLKSIPYRFYTIVALFTVLATILLQREVSPMYEAEITAREGKKTKGWVEVGGETKLEGKSLKGAAWISVIVIAFLISSIIFFLVKTGADNTKRSIFEAIRSISNLKDTISNADSFSALLWGSFLSAVLAFTLVVLTGALSVKEAMEGFAGGIQAMVTPILIMTLAWSLGKVTQELGTAKYVVEIVKGKIPPFLFASVVFITSAITSFATGTSWGTMAVILPMAVPAIIAMDPKFLYPVISACLAGSVFGDHCSPISDTTIISAMASGCSLIEHVKTQLPYALFAALSAVVLYILSSVIPVVLLIPVAIAIPFIFIRAVGKVVDNDTI